MARRVKDRNLDSRDARGKLKPSRKPYWRAIGKCLHIGYRKGKTSGVWVIRRYLGNQTSGPVGSKRQPSCHVRRVHRKRDRDEILTTRETHVRGLPTLNADDCRLFPQQKA